jgi:phosphinothricin acetyltransferase
MASLIIRAATVADAEALVAIYAPYVQSTAITYEYEVPSLDEFSRRIETYSQKYPYLVAEADGIPVGYAYASPLGSRPAFDWSIETAIYVREDCKGMGIGRALYEKLEEILRLQGIRTMTAAVATVAHDDPYLTNASLSFHLRMGFTPVGTFRNCGCKFGRWYDLTWLEKPIGAYEENPPMVKTIGEICDSFEEHGNYEFDQMD